MARQILDQTPSNLISTSSKSSSAARSTICDDLYDRRRIDNSASCSQTSRRRRLLGPSTEANRDGQRRRAAKYLETNGVARLLAGNPAYEIFDPVDRTAIEFENYIPCMNSCTGCRGAAPDIDDEQSAIRQAEKMAFSFSQLGYDDSHSGSGLGSQYRRPGHCDDCDR